MASHLLRQALIFTLAMSACAGSPAEELLPLPPIEGLTAAPDLDPAEDVVEVHLTASTTSVSWADGPTTEAWAYNGEVPGPLVQARVGDTLVVQFTNDLPEPTTIHWHGLRVPDAMDGVPAIQDPVQPGETFRYEFVLPDAGTFWYHPHVRAHEQVERGLQGMLVVHEREPLQDVVQRGFVLDDALIDESGSWYTFDVDNSHPLQMMGRNGNTLLVNGGSDAVQATLTPGVAERWRLVNTANARTLWAEVRGANWRVIGVDGGRIATPYTTERVRLPVGRRFDLEVIPTGRDEEVALDVVLPNRSGGWDRYPMFEASLDWTAPGTGQSLDWPTVDTSGRPEVRQEIVLDFDGRGGGANIEWTINGRIWGQHDALEVEADTPTRIVLRDGSRPQHPFHLHGQFCEIVGRDGQAVDEPGQFDTVLLTGDDEVELFSMMDNPGRWMAHCHILEHAERGMMTEVVVGPSTE